jgi:hypothetical protein
MDDYLNKFNKIYEQKCSNNFLPSVLPAVKRIIVIGDIHGDMDKLLKCLRIPNLIDNNNNWIGGETVVVQVGDQIDSCRFKGSKSNCNQPNHSALDEAEDIKILYYLTELHNQASKEGGAVYSLMGNHEFMNVDGDMRFVSHSNIREFDNYNHNGKIINDGLEGRKLAFKPGNKIANFLACTRRMGLIIGNNLFVHAGIVPEMRGKYNIDDMNKLLSLFLLNELEQPEIFRDLFMNGNISPMWTRKFGFKNINNCDELSTTLKYYKVGKMFVGHTPQFKEGINSQCDNQIWRTDIGMSRAFDISNMIRDVQVLEILKDGEIINILK